MKVLAFIPFLIACGGGTSSGSCDTQSVNQACLDYSASPDVLDVYKNNCAPGTWSTNPCTSTNRVGGCRAVQNGISVTTWFYGAPNTPQSVMAACGSATFVQ
jgi:hypothetical protein